MKKTLKKTWSFLLAFTLLVTQLAVNPVPASAADKPQITINANKKVDVALAVGSTDVDYSAFEKQLKEAIGNRIPADSLNIMATTSVDTSTSDKFDWLTFDHSKSNYAATNDFIDASNESNANAYNALDRHVDLDTTNGTKLTFKGYGSNGYSDFMLLESNQTTNKTFQFNIKEYFAADALFNMGFFFNSNITYNTATYSDMYAAYQADKLYLNGYLMALIYNGQSTTGIAIYQVKNLPLKGYHNNSLGIVGAIGANTTYFTQIASLSAGSGAYKASDDLRKFRVEVTPSSVMVYYAGFDDTSHSVTMIESENDAVPFNEANAGYVAFANTSYADLSPLTFKLNDNSQVTKVPLSVKSGGSDFGPLVKYGSHSCARLTKVELSDLTMATDVVRTLSEVVREPQWQEDSAKVLVNLNEDPINDFDDAALTGELLNRLQNNDIYYVGWCSDTNSGKSEQFLEKNDLKGAIINMDDAKYPTVDAQIKAIADAVVDCYNTTSGTTTDGDATVVTRGNEIVLDVTGADATNTADDEHPNGKWIVVYHDTAGNSTVDIMSDLKPDFSNAGTYEIYYDTVKEENLVKTIIVNEPPKADFTVQVATSGAIEVTLTNTSTDLEGDNLINTWSYMDVSTGGAIALTQDGNAQVKFPMENGKIYLVTLTVTDKWGASSTTSRQVSYDESSASAPPIADFALTPARIMKNAAGKVVGGGSNQIIITDKSYDLYGKELTYSFTSPNTGVTVSEQAGTYTIDTTGLSAGTYTVYLEVNNGTKTSNRVGHFFTITEDTQFPVASANPASGSLTANTSIVVLSFTDEGTGVARHKEIISASSTEPTTDEWNAVSYKATTSQNVSLNGREGIYYIHYLVEDNAGNRTIAYAGPYTVDTIAPTAAAEPASGNLETEKPTVTITYTDGGSGVAKHKEIVSSSATEPVAAEWAAVSYKTSTSQEVSLDGLTGTYYIYYMVEDNAGNQRIGYVGPYGVDTKAPTAVISPQTMDWTDSNTTVNITYTDEGSGVARHKEIVSNSAAAPTTAEWNAESYKETTMQNISLNGQEGTYYIHYLVEDKAGNRTVDCAGPYTVDKVAPVASSDRTSDKLTAETSTITISYTDKVSGVAWHKEIVSASETAPDSTAWEKVLENTTAEQQISLIGQEGTYYIYYLVEDKAGNQRTGYVGPYTIDDKAPMADADPAPGELPDRTPTVTIRYTDGESGIAEHKEIVSASATTPTNAEWNALAPKASNEAEISLQGLEGDYYIHYLVKDKEGNQTVGYAGPYSVDAKAPTATANREAGELTATDSTVTISYTDEKSGVARHKEIISASPEFPSLADWENEYYKTSTEAGVSLKGLEGTYYIYYLVEDKAGNQRIDRVGPYTIDDKAPVITELVSPKNGETGTPVTPFITFKTNEAVKKGSGYLYIKKASDDSVVYSIAVSNNAVRIDGNTITVEPMISLSNDTAYYISLSEGFVTDLKGNKLAAQDGKTSWRFTTKAAAENVASKEIKIVDVEVTQVIDNGKGGTETTQTKAQSGNKETTFVVNVYDDSDTDTTIHVNIKPNYSVKPEKDEVIISTNSAITYTTAANGSYDVVVPGSVAAKDKTVTITVKDETYTILFSSLGPKWRKITSDVISNGTMKATASKINLENSVDLSEVLEDVSESVEVNIRLVADTENIDTDDQSKLENAIDGKLKFVDLQVTKEVVTNSVVTSKTNIHDTLVPIKVRLTLPTELQGGRYEIKVYRIHDDVITFLESTLVDSSTAVEFESDAYSTYALRYEEMPMYGGVTSPADTVNETPVVFETTNPKDAAVLLESNKTVTEVTFNGKVLDASAYEIKDGQIVIRKGILAGLEKGSYQFVVTYNDKSSETFTLNVVSYDKAATLTSVPVFYMVKNMSVGNSFTLRLTGIQNIAEVTYESSDTKVVSVTSNGTIKAKKNGSTTLTATITQNGSQYKVKIKMKVRKGMPFNRTIAMEDAITVNTSLPVLNIYKRVAVGSKTDLTIKNIAKDAVVTYSSDNTGVATVSKSGVIKGTGSGECVVTAKIKQNGKTYCYKILVRVPKTK